MAWCRIFMVDRPNLDPIEELKTLSQEVENARELEDLRPIFYRAEEIAKEHPDNFSVQLTAGDLKQHLVAHGNMLKERVAPSTAFPSVQPPPPPDLDLGMKTVVLPTPGMPRHGLTPEPPVPHFPDRQESRVHEGPAKSRPGLWGMVAAGGVVLIIAAFLFVKFGLIPLPGRASVEAPVHVATIPAGAAIRVNGQAKCTSDCSVSLAAGKYEISATLDGYEPAAMAMTVTPGQEPSAILKLVPQGQSVRIITDLSKGRIVFDSQSPADLQKGQYLIDKVTPGLHRVKVTGTNREASFSLELATAKPPSITGTVITRNILAVLVGSFGSQARVVTSSGPWQMAVNGQPENEAGPAGVRLKNFRAGENEIVLKQGTDRHAFKQSFGSTPALTAFLITDMSVGTLTVVTGVKSVHVSVNGREYLSKNGVLRIKTIGRVSVRVSKQGFENLPPQIVELKKGGQARVEFKMKALRRP